MKENRVLNERGENSKVCWVGRRLYRKLLRETLGDVTGEVQGDTLGGNIPSLYLK